MEPADVARLELVEIDEVPIVDIPLPTDRFLAFRDGDAMSILAEDFISGESFGLVSETVDTDQLYRVIMFADGTVRGIPATAEAPDPPTGLGSVARISSVKLTWDAADGAATYRIYRDGTAIGSTSNLKYRDGNVTVGATYDYKVRSISVYQLPSTFSDTETVFINPALNVTPEVTVKVWPPSAIALGNRAIVRVNALDPDGQLLALALGTDVGTLIATTDPSVWILEPV